MTAVKTEHFGDWTDGQAVECIVVSNDKGMQIKLLPIGASIQSLRVPDKQGQLKDIVLGYDTVSGYASNPDYLGCIVGRCANRIANAQFSLAGTDHQLTANAGKDHLHGGTTGLSRRLWSSAMEQHVDRDAVGVSFYLESPDGEDGYPGNLSLRVCYTLDQHQTLHIEYFARTDQTTVVNLTNHSYFNLEGHDAGDIRNHKLRLFSNQITPTDEALLPTGEIISVDGCLDFRRGKMLGTDIDDPTLKSKGGYDHTFVVNTEGQRMSLAAVLSADKTGIRMAVSTSEPTLQLFTANHLAIDEGKDAQSYLRYEGVCLETQRFPDAVNQPNFPSIVLEADELYYSKTTFRFDTFDA